jgi:hypothetical protein
MANKNDVAILASYDSPFEANVVAGALEAYGITASVMGDSTANCLLQGFKQGQMSVVVRQCDLERARELLSEMPPTEEFDEDNLDIDPDLIVDDLPY